MIRIRRGRLPEGLQALARHDHGAVVVYVSAALSASERAAAIRRALRAAPEAGWRSPRSPVVLPALAGGAGLPLAPGGRWAYRALFAAAAAAVIAVVTVLVLAGGSPGRDTARSTTALRPAASPTAADPARPGAPGSRTGSAADPGTVSGPSPGKPGTRVKAGQPATAGQGPAPQTSGKPTPVPTVTASPTSRPSPAASEPSPSPSPSPVGNPAGPGCLDVLGVKICR
jgi:hypothetical protein